MARRKVRRENMNLRAIIGGATMAVAIVLLPLCGQASGEEASPSSPGKMLSVCEDDSSIEEAIADYIKAKKGWKLRYEYRGPDRKDLVLRCEFWFEGVPSLRVAIDTAVSGRNPEDGSVSEMVILIRSLYETPQRAKGKQTQLDIIQAINRWHRKVWAPGHMQLDSDGDIVLSTTINIPGKESAVPAEMVVDAINRMGASWYRFYKEELRRLVEDPSNEVTGAEKSTTRPSAILGGELPELTAALGDPAALEAEARRIERLDNTIFRGIAEQIFQRGTALEKSNEIQDAERWYELGLGRFTWDLQHQLDYAGFLLRHGKPEKGRERAELVAAYAEDPNMRRSALSLIDRPARTDFRKMVKVGGEGPVVVLVPFGAPEADLIDDVRANLERLLGVRVIVQAVDIAMPKPSRDKFADIAKEIRGFIVFSQGSPGLKWAMDKTGITTKDIDDDEKVVRLYEAIAETDHDGSQMRWFRNGISVARRLGKQWDASEIIETLKNAVQPYRRDKVAYIAVTDVDIHVGKDSNFVFAHVVDEFATVSYRRFRSEFMGSMSNRKRLAERLLKQCLSVSANALGVKRCSCLSCPYASAGSLEEHDLRTTRFCSECQAALEKLVRPKP